MTMTKLRSHGKRSLLLLLTAAAASVAVLVVGSGSIFGSSESGSAEPWRMLPSAPIEIDAGLTSVWTGEEMLVSGLTAAPDGSLLGAVEVAAAYDPETNGWRRLGAPPKTESSCRRSAVWTGTEMLVWGCGPTAFNPQADRWRRLPAAPIGAPGLAVWTGRELIGWGGGCCGDATADGAAYDPAGNTWRRLAPSPLAGSQSPLGAWTGRELILFVSGLDPDGRPIEGAARAAAYRPAPRHLAPHRADAVASQRRKGALGRPRGPRRRRDRRARQGCDRRLRLQPGDQPLAVVAPDAGRRIASRLGVDGQAAARLRRRDRARPPARLRPGRRPVVAPSECPSGGPARPNSGLDGR